MPMAGAGSRFGAAGITAPKPLVEIGGACLFEWSLWGALAGLEIARVVLVVREPIAREVSERAARRRLDCDIVVLDHLTDGAATTVMAATEKAAVDPEAPLVIVDCDAFSLSEQGATSAFLSVARSTEPAFSYVVMSGDAVSDIVEKDVVSPLAVTGTYGFPSAAVFGSSYEASRAGRREEHFMSDVVRAAINRGTRFSIRVASPFVPLGTPEQVGAAAARLESIGNPPEDFGALLV